MGVEIPSGSARSGPPYATICLVRVAMVVREGPLNPAARVRALQYVPLLRAGDDEVRTLYWRGSSRRTVAVDGANLLRLSRWADVVFLQRPTQPEGLLRAVARVNPRLVVDFDDALWVGSDGRPAPAYRDRLVAAIKLSRAVTPGSEYLGSWVTSSISQASVTVLRPSIDTKRFDDGTERRSAARCTIGWIGTGGNLRDFDDEIVAALRRMHTSGPAHRLTIISSAQLIVPGLSPTLVAWSAEHEARALSELDIGVMPLLDDERSRGRCGFKAIQYLAAGVPAVVSPIGAGREVVADGTTGRWATTRREWRAALEELIDDPSERTRLGTAGRQWVEEHASLRSTFPRLREVLAAASEVD